MTRLSKLEKTGVCEEDLWEFGFEGQKLVDPDEGEDYYQLWLNGEIVGYTDLNGENGDIEIICESKVDYDKVIKVVGEAVTVWAWYNNVVTNNN